MNDSLTERLRTLRRELHQYPEPGWCEYNTTSRIVDELERIGVDTYYLGAKALSVDDRIAVPPEDEQERWLSKARKEGAREDVLQRAEGARTGAVAVIEQGDGPTVGLRVDIDALRITEAEDVEHHPAREGFRSENEGLMHACGHDSHITIGVGVLEAIKQSEFEGTLKVFFQPAEEEIGGGKPMAKSGHTEDIDFFFAVHIGLDYPTGEVIGGIQDFYAVNHFDVSFEGQSSHAGAHPEDGKNAALAMATTIQNLYAIPRHADGATRVNVGHVEAGSAPNIVPESASIEGEVRGDTSSLVTYMRTHADRIVANAAEMHDCKASIETVGEAPSAESDDQLSEVVQAVAKAHPEVETARQQAPIGGSEDATYLMQAVQDQGGNATYVGIGTDRPGGHHTPRFDIDESSIPIGVDVLTDAILAIAEQT